MFIYLKKVFLAFSFLLMFPMHAEIYPIQFSISEKKIVDSIPEKIQDFAFILPGQLWTYIFSEEEDYYDDYKRSYFAHTCKKGGWDCLRHYEILANGCIPYFTDLESAPLETMFLLPRELILEAMHLPGVTPYGIDHTIFDKQRYYEILNELLNYTRTHLTSRALAEYLLNVMNYNGVGKILYLSDDISPDYMRCYTLIGLKELLGDRVVDVPKIPHIYMNYPQDIKQLYGKGMSYTEIVEDVPIDRENIEARIRDKEFDFVIYGSVHRGLRFHNLVQQYYSPDEIFYICGEDAHTCEYKDLPHLFLRESDSIGYKVSPKEGELIHHVKKSIYDAKRGISKLNSSVLEIDGMSSDKVRHLLNNLCSRKDTRYLEIGTWKGSTWISALYRNENVVTKATAIDNWTEYEGPYFEFIRNCEAFLPDLPQYKLHIEDCFSLALENFDESINVYLYGARLGLVKKFLKSNGVKI